MNTALPPPADGFASAASCTSAERINMRMPYRSDSQRTNIPRTNGARATFDVRSGESSASR